MIWEDAGLENDPSGPLWERMVDAVLAEDPDAKVAPYCLSGGTDNKSFARLGISGYGFAPLQLPPDLDFPALFHGVDERMPLDALRSASGCSTASSTPPEPVDAAGVGYS